MVQLLRSSSAHANPSDAYWIQRLLEGQSSASIWLGKGERQILPITEPAGERIARLLEQAHSHVISSLAYCCHDLAEHIFGEPGSFRRMRVAVPRGQAMGPELAAQRLGLPCGIQFQNPQDAHAPVLHSAVLLGMDTGLPAELPASERAIVLHKPGREELEIVTLAAAVRRYADKLRDITYYRV